MKLVAHVEFEQKLADTGDPVGREALRIGQPIAERKE
jgi:hypothetical protein